MLFMFFWETMVNPKTLNSAIRILLDCHFVSADNTVIDIEL